MPRPVVPSRPRRALARLVERDVPVEDHVRAAGDAHPRGVAQHALPLDLVELVEQHARIHHHAGPDQVHRARLEDPRRHQVQDGLLAVHDQGVPGVVAAVEAHHQIGRERKPVDDLALALVPPLRADRDERRHGPRSTSCAVIMCGSARSFSITASAGG
jgi:hypothetical protein